MKNILFAIIFFGTTHLNGQSSLSTSCEILEKHPVILTVGTRPEAIKMAPLYEELRCLGIPTLLCSTGQHKQMVGEVFKVFAITPDVDLEIMKKGQDLFHITVQVLEKMGKLFEQVHPSLVVVQGDTTSAMATALAAFYKGIPIAHVEAGLRTGNIRAPFPEELNRRAISLIASQHFAPTKKSVENLMKEGIDDRTVLCTGNTVVDALCQIKERIDRALLSPAPWLSHVVDERQRAGHKILLLTAHRRESLGEGLENIFRAVKEALDTFPDLYVIYPKHPNPAIQKILEESSLSLSPQIMITPPLSYIDMVYLLHKATAIATDSGGLQEEAVSLRKPVLILREETDRPEGIQEGLALLVGTKEEKILQGIASVLRRSHDSSHDLDTSSIESIYGDGHASARIAQWIQNHINLNFGFFRPLNLRESSK